MIGWHIAYLLVIAFMGYLLYRNGKRHREDADGALSRLTEILTSGRISRSQD